MFPINYNSLFNIRNAQNVISKKKKMNSKCPGIPTMPGEKKGNKT